MKSIMSISGGDDWRVFYHALEPVSWHYRFFFVLFMFYSVFAFMNVVISAFVESILEAAKSDREMMVQAELKVITSVSPTGWN